MTAHKVAAYTLPDWEGNPVQVVSLAEATDALDLWRSVDRGRRNYGFTSTEASDDPEHILVFWIDQDRLQTAYVAPFGNDVQDFNAYALGDLNLIPGIHLEAIA